MKRAEVWWIEFPGAVAGEVRKGRPAVIVSNNSANQHLNRVQIVPLTTSIDKVYPSEALVTVRGKKHKAMADQLTTAAKTRISNKIGRISESDMEKVGKAIKIQLDLAD